MVKFGWNMEWIGGLIVARTDEMKAGIWLYFVII